VRADDGVHRQVIGPTAQRLDVAARVGVVIGERAEVDDLVAARLERMAKAVRIANAAEGRHALAAECIDGDLGAN
jgi:hypothetical protein